MIQRTIHWILAALFLFTISFSAKADTEYKAGIAKTVITPEANLWMSGYASRNHPAEGKYQDLFAKALALEDQQGNRAVLVTIDLIGISNSIGERVAQRVQQEISLNRDSILFATSHTHSGPVLRDNLEVMYNLSPDQWNLISDYTQLLEKKLGDVILEAVKNLKPARLSRGTGNAKFVINRRQYNLNGISIGENHIAPVDQDVPTLKVTDENGKILGVVFGYACHNTTLSSYQYCGDYAGYAQEYLEVMLPDSTALFFSGCGADANPIPRGKLEHAKAHGMELALAVNKVINEPMKDVKGSIQTVMNRINLPLTPPPTREQLEKQKQSDNIYIQRRAQYLQTKLDKEGKIADTYSYPVQVWKFGEDFMIAALAGEVVVDYDLRLKHEFGSDRIWVIGYANDVFAYIPSLRVLREGGYEADDSMIYYGIHGPWAPPVEEMIVQEVHKLAK